MDDNDFLDDMLPTSETPVEAETEGKAPVRDEQGRFAPKGVEPQETAEPVPPTEPVDKLPPEEFAGLKDERRKRQEAEQRAAALEQQLQSLQQPPAPPPSIWEDEQGAFQHHADSIAAQASLNARLDMSEMLASQNHDDFDDMKAKFIEMMGMNPALQKQALEAKHPWEKAYQIAKNAATAAELGATNVAELEAKIEARIRGELAQAAPAQAIPTTLADAQSGRTGHATAPAPMTLKDILGGP